MNDKTTETTALSSDATEVRRQKLALLREQIGDVYPAHFHRTLTNAELAEKYADIEPDTETGDTVTVAGRVYSSRNSGMFMDIHDASGKVQIFSHKDTTPETARNLLPMIDIGDIIGVTGKVRRTKRGELTINAEEITMLTKSLLPMPEKWHGVSDIELRYRKRHLDILANEDSKLRFLQRSKILSGIRRFMEAEGFLEVETPMLQTVYGGATADPFKTFHNTLKMDMYLRIAPELFLKRTLVSGLSDKVFEINRNFRNEGVSTRHNPEFTMMECYWAYADYEDIMGLVERLFETLAIALHGTTEVEFQGQTISFKGPFKRVPMPDAVKEATGIDFLAIKTDEEARAAAKAAGFAVEKDWTGANALPSSSKRRSKVRLSSRATSRISRRISRPSPKKCRANRASLSVLRAIVTPGKWAMPSPNSTIPKSSAAAWWSSLSRPMPAVKRTSSWTTNSSTPSIRACHPPAASASASIV